MTVKEKIMEALGGAIKDASRPMAIAFMQNPSETSIHFNISDEIQNKNFRI